MSASDSISDDLYSFSGGTDIAESSVEEISVVTIVEKINKIWSLLQVTNDNLEACDQLLVGYWPQDDAAASKNSQNTSKSSTAALITFASHPFVQYRSVSGSIPSSTNTAEDYKLENVISSSAPASPLLIVRSRMPLNESSDDIQTSYPFVQPHTVKRVTLTSDQASSLALPNQVAVHVTSVSAQISSPFIQDDKTENVFSDTAQDEMTATVKSTAIQTSCPVLQTSYAQTSSLTAQDGKPSDLKRDSSPPSSTVQDFKLVNVKSTSVQTSHQTPQDWMLLNLKSTSAQTTSLNPNDWRIISVKSSSVQTSSSTPQDQTCSLVPQNQVHVGVKSISVQTSPTPQNFNCFEAKSVSVQTSSQALKDLKSADAKSVSAVTASPPSQDLKNVDGELVSLQASQSYVVTKLFLTQTSSPAPQDGTGIDGKSVSMQTSETYVDVESVSTQTSNPTSQVRKNVNGKSVSVQTSETGFDTRSVPTQTSSPSPQYWTGVGTKSVSIQTSSPTSQVRKYVDGKSVSVQASLTCVDTKSVSVQTSQMCVDAKSVSIQTSLTGVDTKQVSLQTFSPPIQDSTNIEVKTISTQTSSPVPQFWTSSNVKSVSVQTSSPAPQFWTSSDVKSVSVQTSSPVPQFWTSSDVKSVSVQTSSPAPQFWTSSDVKSVSVQTSSPAPQFWTSSGVKSVSVQTSSPAPQFWTSSDVKSVSVQTSSPAPQFWTSSDVKSVLVQTSSPVPQFWTSIDVKSVSVQTSGLVPQEWTCDDAQSVSVQTCSTATHFQTAVHFKSSAQSTDSVSQNEKSVNNEPKLANIPIPSIKDKIPVKTTSSSSQTSVPYEPLANLMSPSAHTAPVTTASTSTQTWFPIMQYNMCKEEMPVCFYSEQTSVSEDNLCACTLQRKMNVPKSVSMVQNLYAGDKPRSSTTQEESYIAKHTQTRLFGVSACTQTHTSVCLSTGVQAVLHCNSSTQTNTAVACQTEKLKGTVNHVMRIEQHCSELHRRITSMLCTVEQQKGEAVQMRMAVNRVLHSLEQEGKEVDQYLLQDAERGEMLLWQCRHSRDITLGTLRALNRRAMLAERQLISERRDLVFLRSKYRQLSRDLYNLKIRLARHSSQLRFAAQLRYRTHCRYRLQLGHVHRLLNARKNRVRRLQQVLLRVRDLCHSIDSGYQVLLCEMWKQIDATAQLAAQDSNLPAPPSAAEKSKNLADHLQHMLETIRWIQMALSTRHQHFDESSKVILDSTSYDMGSSSSKEDTMNIITDCSWSEDLTGSDALQRRLLLILDRLQENLLQAGPDVHLTN